MRVGIAEARERFKEVLDRVGAGELVEITRRGEVVAVMAPPSSGRGVNESFGEALHDWRTRWDVGSWPDEDPFADVRDTARGRAAPW